ncbi:MAG: ATP-binding protein [Selenomonadaceae bacterium]|nr:ATP-binding protein [Selenomonadaceae bacterium]MBQ6758258.1 ATP-binding protein [Selenomonadaceae bacterium]MBR0102332.1 ATP-binding protein [Selenomonadaceae bacterium]
MEKITVDALLDNLQAVVDFATEKLEARDCSMKVVMQTELVIEEIFVNIASYAYHPEIGPATFCMEFEENPNAVLMTFIDGGKPYNPLEQEAPDTTLSIEERDVGGLGIFLVKKNVDEIAYEYTDGKNILRMKKFF